MFNIVISTIDRRADKYCSEKKLPELDTVRVMFSSQIDFYLRRCNHKQKQVKIHDLNNKIVYTINKIESL